jgi:glycosyltransferase involved in cell wall biosynthesis
MNDLPLVSISCITFNHSKYVRQCFDGFLMQKTNFKFEVVVHDDASTDGTKEIIEEYTNKYPDIFFPMYQKENQYSKGVRGFMPKFNFPRCRGKYIALCEGDDYWTDENKLQKQVDFLENNEEYVLCFHKLNILKISGKIEIDDITNVPEKHDRLEDLVKYGNYIHTSSVVFRYDNITMPKEFFLSPAGDFFLYIIISKQGKLKYLEDIMSVYREGVGVWSSKDYFFRHLNTAYIFSLLLNVFDDNLKVSEILLDRINLFLKTYESKLTSENLYKLAINEKTNKLIFDFLLSQKKHYESQNISNLSTIKIAYFLIRRIKNKFIK